MISIESTDGQKIKLVGIAYVIVTAVFVMVYQAIHDFAAEKWKRWLPMVFGLGLLLVEVWGMAPYLAFLQRRNDQQNQTNNRYAAELRQTLLEMDLSIRVLPLRREDGLYARFEVEDNGVSATPGELEQLREKLSGPVLQDSGDNNGFALSNVNRRLKLVFGNSAGIHASCGADGQGFLVTFTIPAVLPENLT